MPSGFGTARYIAEPGKVLKLYVCANYDQSAQRIPSDCDWFGAAGLDRIEVKWALGEAVLLALLLILLWSRLLRGRGAALLGLLLALAGLGVGVYGTLRETTIWTPVGLVAFGLGMLLVGLPMRRLGRPGLGWTTLLIAAFALLGAVDRGLWMLPWIPVPPSLLRILLEVVWAPWALIAIFAGKVLAGSRPPRADPLVRFAAALRH